MAEHLSFDTIGRMPQRQVSCEMSIDRASCTVTRTLHTESVTWSSVGLQVGDCKRQLVSLQVTIRESNEPAPSTQSEASLEQEEIVFGLRARAVLGVTLSGAQRLPTAYLSISGLPGVFSKLWDEADKPGELYLTIYVLGCEQYQPLVLDEEGSFSATTNVKLSFRSGITPRSMSTHVLNEVLEGLSGEFINEGASKSQMLAHIARELSGSVVDNAWSLREREELTERACKVLEDARCAFHGPGWDKPGYAGDNVDAFNEKLKSVPEDEAEKYRDRYNQLWRHFPVKDVIARGEASAGAAASGFEPSLEDLEELAKTLVADRRLASPTLEWAVVDALVYAECLAFAQHVVPNKKMFGLSVPAPLTGGTSAWRDIRQSAVGMAIEILKILATFGIAQGLTDGNQLAVWVVTTGVTAARWVRLAVLWDKMHPEQKQLILLGEMLEVQHQLRRRDFNARALRLALDTVSRHGASFSPWVSSLLDCRVREFATGSSRTGLG